MEVGREIMAIEAKNSNLKVQISLMVATARIVGKVRAITIINKVIGSHLYATGVTKLCT